MLFLLRTKLQRINELECVTKVVAAPKFIFDLTKNLADLVLKSIGACGALLEPM